MYFYLWAVQCRFYGIYAIVRWHICIEGSKIYGSERCIFGRLLLADSLLIKSVVSLIYEQSCCVTGFK